jgi:hypothetical protein
MKSFARLLSIIWSFLLVAVVTIGAGTVLGAIPNIDQPARILCAGSSSLYYHNQPMLIAEWLTKLGSMPARSEIVGKSGTGVHVYLRPDFKVDYGLEKGQTILEKIRKEKYDYVILQIPAEFIVGPEGQEHDRSLDVYCKAIREAGGRPVFYEMGWRRDDKAEGGRQKIFAAAVRNKALLFVPCSSAWKRVRQERPDLELHNPPDTVHPGTLGLYLNLCCFYATLTGKPPRDMPAKLKVWRPAKTEKEKAQANVVYQNTHITNPYIKALPGWMQRNSVNAKAERVDEATARYLEKVAWEEYLAFQERLKKAISVKGNRR